MTPPANDVEAALTAWEAARHRSETQAPYSAAATLRVAGHALAELVARIPTLEAALATYGGHLSSCLSIRAGRDCDCGWDSTACGRVRGVGHMETMADPYRRGRTEVLVSAPPEPSPPMEIRAPEALRPPALTEIQKWEIVAEALRNGTVDSREKTLALRAEVSSLTAERDAYRRAKAENDERFQVELAYTRAALSAAREELAKWGWGDHHYGATPQEKPFSWTCGSDFWNRYHTDVWVFNLANAVLRLHERVVAFESEEAPTP